jgi:hypothetical protein
VLGDIVPLPRLRRQSRPIAPHLLISTLSLCVCVCARWQAGTAAVATGASCGGNLHSMSLACQVVA